MLSEDRRIKLKQLIEENFPKLSEEKREEVFQKMVNKPGEWILYLVYWGDNLARIGVQCKENGTTQRHYLCTKYDSEFLDW